MRSCVGCGRKASQAELLRFAAADGELVPGFRVPGRGAYTCRRLQCFERARTKGGFARVLHAKVNVQPALRDLYTDH